MRIFGFEINRPRTEGKAMRPPSGSGGWWPIVREPFTGAWQRNKEISRETALTYHAVFACQTLIASDIAKLRVKLVAQDSDGIWSEVQNPAYSPVLRKPNDYQTRIQFFESWVHSKLSRGNAYVLLVRDNRRVVVGMHVLNPDRVQPLVADDGSVFYQLGEDVLAGIGGSVAVPAREIIHDRFNCLYHPLVGVSPLMAAGVAAMQGLAIQTASTKFFGNGSRPGGILSAPANIPSEVAQRIKEYWDANYTGENVGKVAVLGDGLKYESLSVAANDAQLIEQLQWSSEIVASVYHVPPYKIGVGTMPNASNAEVFDLEYYKQCLQVMIEAIELCLDEGLGTGSALGTEFDTDNLLRMDTARLIEAMSMASGAGLLEIDEARFRMGYGKTAGGDAAYLQQQNYSLAALAKRDAQADPFGTAAPANDPAPVEPELDDEAKGALLASYLRKELLG